MDVRSFHPMTDENAAAPPEARLRLLIDTGLLLSSERSLDVLVQAYVDAGLALSGAAVGVFLHTKSGAGGASYQVCTFAAANRRFFRGSPGQVTPPQVASTPYGQTIERVDDVTSDARYGADWLLFGMPASDVPVRSYLSVPVRSQGSEVLGAMLYGHPQAGVFDATCESLVAVVAAQAAAALENARLKEKLQGEVSLAEAARAEQRATEGRLRQALDAAELGTWSWKASTDEVDFDERAAEIFGAPSNCPFPRSELRGRILEDDLAQSTEDLNAVMKSGEQYVAEYRVVAGEGGERWIAVRGNVTYDDHAQPMGLIGTAQDVSMRKQQEHSLLQSEKIAATGRLAATIAHEINNPIEAVTNLIYLAKTDQGTPASVQRMLDVADTELARVAQIAQQTLGFYRDTTRPVTIDLNELVQAVVDLFNRKLAGKRLQCVLDMDPGLSIVGLQGEIRQVVSNLLVNAIDASSGTGGSIKIRGRHRHRNGDHGVSMLISDQGSGIPGHVRHRLFTPFVTTKQVHGTGLGLWVTRGMVEKHGGTVCFRSRTESPAGTVFRVFLPRTGAAPLFDSPISPVLQ